MASTLMRVSEDRAALVKDKADHEGRTYVAELDRIIDAGLATLYGAPKRGRKAG